LRAHRRFRTVATAVAACAALGLAMFTTSLGPAPSRASSHREAPLVSADPQVDTTDFYMFVAPNKPNTVTLVSTWIPFEEPAGGPNFYTFADGVHYDFNIDNDGDAKADIIFRFVFTTHTRNGGTFLFNTGPVTTLDDPDLNVYQTYDLTAMWPDTGRTKKLLDDALSVPSRVGDASMPDYDSLRSQGIQPIGSMNAKAFAGQADDPFFLDLRVFDLLYGANLSEVGDDTLDGFNVNALALQIPKHILAKSEDPDANPIIGGWASAERQSVRTQKSDGTVGFSGDYVEVSRLGMPLVNEVVIPVGQKDKWNGSLPQDDAQFLPYVTDPEVPHVVESLYGIPVPDSDPNTPGVQRDDLVQVFLTGIPGLNQPPNVTASEQLRLNMSIPPCEPASCAAYSRLGVIGGDNAGYPNGRRLADDVIDISLQVVEGVLLGQDTGLGDGVDANDVPFGTVFPYVATPASGSDPAPHGATHVR
jgi:uncharacterized protein DUF4331